MQAQHEGDLLNAANDVGSAIQHSHGRSSDIERINVGVPSSIPISCLFSSRWERCCPESLADAASVMRSPACLSPNGRRA